MSDGSSNIPGDIGGLLRDAGLRPTRQRIALATLLYSKGDRHVTAELLHEEAVEAGEQVSLATVYNTLHQFQEAGLLREIAIGALASSVTCSVLVRFRCRSRRAVCARQPPRAGAYVAS